MSTANPMLLTQNQATASERVMLFHLTLSADHVSNATGKVPTATISKAGAAFAAPVGAITEIANGWYKLALAAGDLDTPGALGVLITEASSDPLRVVHQVEKLDLMDANAGGLADLATVAAQQATISTSVAPSRTTQSALGTLTTVARTSAAKSMKHAVSGRVDVAGVFGVGGSVQVQTTEDLVNWTNYGAAKTAAGTVPITEPHAGVRAVLSSGDGTSAVVTTLTMSSNS